MTKNIKERSLSNMAWRFAERCGAQGVAFIISIILARLLDPSAYGTIALITVFTAILQVFVDSGLGNALIQKKNADQIDFSTVFYFNIAMCLIVYMVLFFCAPFIANFYEDSSLTGLIRVLGITLIISGLKNIQQAYVSKKMLFKKFFFSTLSGTIFAAILGISLAYMGFGAWALVIQQVANTFIDTCVLYATVKWRPTREFSFERLNSLFSYGWKLLISALIDTGYNNLRSLLIGKIYSPSDLAYYNKGKQLPSLMVTNINNSIDSILLPVMSEAQDDVNRVKNMTRRSIKISSYILWPVMMGVAVCSDSIISVLLTDKWLMCVPYLQLYCFTYAFWPIHTANLNAIKAMGRSDLFLKIEIIKKIIGLTSIIVSVNISVFAMAVAMAITAPISSFINAYPNKKLLKYSYFEQIIDTFPSLILTFFMGGIVYSINLLDLDNIITLIIQIVSGFVIYYFGSRFLNLESFVYLKDIIKNYRK